ncbi:MAG TPA: L,D-transpeptidase family protein, partial [Thermoanaerobaculia bacterium]|nr:L,D-transpeptidase family protein [Thermoanaerobaculia bacterium]
IAARYAVDAASLAARNGLPPRARLVAGRVLRIDDRHIVPRALADGILINIPQRLLFYFENGRLAAWYPVGLGQPGTWGTPTGSYKVVGREKDPVWKVPVSIQREMRSKGETVRTLVPPGRDNPLGRYRLRLSLDCCGIHGTNAPQSIYRFQTHGCIRLAPADAQALFSRVAIRLPVEIIYEPVLIARGQDGTIYLEVHPDIYGDSQDQTATADAIAYGRGLLSARESQLWKKAIQRQEGIAVSLTLSGERLVENDREALPKETFPGGPGLLPLLRPGEGRGEGTTSSRQSRFLRDLRDVARNDHR